MRHRHGKKRTRVYRIWSGIINRCTNPNEPAYPDYGGRGISVCDRWRAFPNFYADMGDPLPGMSIERVDNDRGYEPNNCKWATRTEQNRNKRSCRLLTMGGETKTLVEWAEQYGLKARTLSQRLIIGWPVEAAITTPIIRKRAGVPRGERLYLHQAWGVAHEVVFRDDSAEAA